MVSKVAAQQKAFWALFGHFVFESKTLRFNKSPKNEQSAAVCDCYDSNKSIFMLHFAI
jgi:hypothetical protein